VRSPQALKDRLGEALLGEAFATAWGEGEALALDEAVAYVRRARGTRKRPPAGWESLTRPSSRSSGMLRRD
jgi:hypothetical protein